MLLHVLPVSETYQLSLPAWQGRQTSGNIHMILRWDGKGD
jgi:hypothetical protein